MSKEKIEQAVAKAEEAFWEAIAKEFPEIKSGDFPYDAAFQHTKANIDAVTCWYEWNKPEEGEKNE